MKLFGLLLLSFAAAHASVTVTRTSNDGPHPSSMEIAVALPDSNKLVHIPLTRNDELDDIPMTLVDNGVSRTFSSRQLHHPSHSHYRDIESKSVISVRSVNGNRQMSGHFMHEGTSYFMEPAGESEHRILKNVRNPEVMAREINITKLRKRQSITSSTTFTVEIQLLLDDTVWSTMRSIFKDDTKTLMELRHYYTHILNGIDTAYRNIQSMSISVKCIGVTLARTAFDSKWMPNTVDGEAILRAMEGYIRGKKGDHFMAFTRKDFATLSSGYSVIGLAYVEGVCTPKKVSINEDHGPHSWGVASHELGHNLGSYHDGDGSSQWCSPRSKNLMTSTTNLYTAADVANAYRFSSCSIQSFMNYIKKLGSSNCLRTTEGTRQPDLSRNSRYGTQITLDRLCKLTFPSSVGKLLLTALTLSNPASICASMHCLTRPPNHGDTVAGLQAPVGTPCGSQRSCNWNGQCTADSSAPRNFKLS